MKKEWKHLLGRIDSIRASVSHTRQQNRPCKAGWKDGRIRRVVFVYFVSILPSPGLADQSETNRTSISGPVIKLAYV